MVTRTYLSNYARRIELRYLAKAVASPQWRFRLPFGMIIRMSEILDISCDEAGHTGPDLLQEDQRIFAFSSVAVGDAEAFEIISKARGLSCADARTQGIEATRDKARATTYRCFVARRGRSIRRERQ